MSNEIETGAVDVAERLRELRRRKGVTIAEMSDMTGIPKRSLENYMRTESPQAPGLDAIIKISLGMNESIDSIVFGSIEKNLEEDFIQRTVNFVAYESLHFYNYDRTRLRALRAKSSMKDIDFDIPEAGVIAVDIGQRVVDTLKLDGKLRARRGRYSVSKST